MAKVSGKMRKSIALYLLAYERFSPNYNPFHACMEAKFEAHDWGLAADVAFARIDGDGWECVACIPSETDRLWKILCGQALLDRQIKDWAAGVAEGCTLTAELRVDFPDFPDRVWKAVANQARVIWRTKRSSGYSAPWFEALQKNWRRRSRLGGGSRA